MVTRTTDKQSSMSQLFQELRRRNVVRTTIAYLAVAWLLLQVVALVGDIFDLPRYAGRYTFFVLLIGLPIALILSWVYELTPQGIKATDDIDVVDAPVRFGERRVNLVIIGALSLVIVLLLLPDPDGDNNEDRSMVSSYRQLTQHQIIFPPTPSPHPLVLDESRIYFNDFAAGRLRVMQIAQTGGEATYLPPFFEESELPAIYEGEQPLIFPHAVTPDGAHLLFSAAARRPGLDLYLWPLIGGSPRLLGAGDKASYSADASQILYTNGLNEIHVASADLADSRMVVTAQSKVYWPRFSPDGQRIRFTSVTARGNDGIWEINADGTDLRLMLPDWDSTHQCCGSWTPDGEYYIFQATRDARTQIWAIRDNDSGTEPFQITTGALDFRRPTIGPDGETIFSIGWQLRGELVRYDDEIERYVAVPGLESLSAEWVRYSRDGEWVAYVSYPEGHLWRSRSDGTNRLQLTFESLKVAQPAWSPNGDFIAFRGQPSEGAPRIYVVGADGGNPRPISAEVRGEGEGRPSWSPEGLLAFDILNRNSIQIHDLARAETSDLPQSEGLRLPTWSPDGRYIATLAAENRTLTLFEVGTGLTEELMQIPDPQFQSWYWSPDSRYLYVSDTFQQFGARWLYRIDLRDERIDKLARLNADGVRGAWGTLGLWVGVAPDGAALQLRDLSIHHIYALDWRERQSSPPEPSPRTPAR